jgi:hypothetical protein
MSKVTFIQLVLPHQSAFRAAPEASTSASTAARSAAATASAPAMPAARKEPEGPDMHARSSCTVRSAAFASTNNLWSSGIVAAASSAL